MGFILYYSTYCVQCQKLIQFISKSDVKNKIHFICIDSRKRDEKGNLFVMLDNGQQMIVPPNITRVPALIVITQNNRLIFGADDIKRYFSGDDTAGGRGDGGGGGGGGGGAATNPYIKMAGAAAAGAGGGGAGGGGGEPTPYILNNAVGCGTSGYGVTSDQYSFYNMTPDELSTKGQGGVRQMHNYVSIHQDTPPQIYTPEETYKPDKVGEISLDKIQQQRNMEVNLPNFTPHMAPPPQNR
jgi:hypothetical protein